MKYWEDVERIYRHYVGAHARITGIRFRYEYAGMNWYTVYFGDCTEANYGIQC